MRLSELLKKENNNIDIFRLIAASMVIYGHAYALSREPGQSDIIGRLMMHQDYSGSIAVKIFFFLSGLVVTNSLINNGDLIRFFISRVFRIWPALILSSLITALVLGPMMTSLTVVDYFNHGDVYSYIFSIAKMKIQYTLPGVFVGNPYPNAVNGSLWTIPYEVFAYVLLFALYAVGILSSKKISVSLFLLILIEPFLKHKLLFPWLPNNHEISFLAPCFAFGAIMALNKDVINVRLAPCLGFVVLYYILRDTVYSSYFAYAFIFLFILYASSREFVLKLKPKVDISYGVYLWGFPVQQIIAHYFNAQGVLFNQVASLAISLALGYFSWHLCEKNFIKYGNSLSTHIKTKYTMFGVISDGDRSCRD